MALTEEWKIGMALAYIAVFVVAVTGNSLVIYLIRSIREMRRIPFNYFMINMATADIVSALFTVPVSLNYIFFGPRWIPGIAGVVLCRFANFGLHISIATSIFTLTLMAVDRYLLIVRTMNKSLTFRSVKLSVLGTWLCAAAVFSTELYKYTIIYHPTLGPICTVDWYFPYLNMTGVWSPESEQAALIVKFILCYALPLPVLFTAYFLIMWRLWKRKNRGQFSDDKQVMNKITVQNRKVVQMLLTVLTAFAICWLPVYIVHFFETFGETQQLLLSATVKQLFFFLAHANSAINPCIYLSFIQKFRNAIQRRYTSKISRGIPNSKRLSELRHLTRNEASASPVLKRDNSLATKCTEESNESCEPGVETRV